MNPTPPVTSQCATSSLASLPVRNADALIAQARLRDLGRAPDVSRVDDDGRIAGEALSYLGEARPAVASPLGKKHEGVRTLERFVVALDHADIAARRGVPHHAREVWTCFRIVPHDLRAARDQRLAKLYRRRLANVVRLRFEGEAP